MRGCHGADTNDRRSAGRARRSFAETWPRRQNCSTVPLVAPRGSAMTTFTEIRYEKRGHAGHVGVITIDRPEARNALTHTTYAELAEAVETTEARCLVITGADPAFCSGDDVKQIMVNAGTEVASGLRT